MNKWKEIVELDTNEDEQIMQEAYCVSALIGQYAIHHLCKEPCSDGDQTGHSWVRKILQGHPIRCYQMFRMEKHIFHQLCTELVGHGLKPTTHVGVEEMVGIFLNIVGHGVGNRLTQEMFQHSGETVSRHFHNVLTACLKLSIAYIKPHDHMFRDSQTKLRNDQRYWPFFKNAIGAIDGTHIPCVVSPSDQARFIGRKGHPTQNIMVVCDWNMCFTFVLPGWEGTAHDARVFDQAITNPSMNFPHPPTDAGYPTPKGFLGPYRCERYHLPDFRRQSGFSNHNEVFNYYHSSLRCTIERTFGVWKNRFAILRKMPKYKIETQVQLVCATMAIHNFIRRHSEMDIDFNHYEDENIIVDTNGPNQHGDVNLESSPVLSISSSPEMDHVRDTIRDQIVMSKNIN
ncbi:uncharacterized protein LOC130720044 [Lotus japonicus]|uniref:uncharacterized protein LOC130720044 n=1 Tax=Lotus japonicus TaxID=34305 RepID=UPI002588ACDF|nr:uncharacterized protein LOC130720044 [Lotus japonicus]